MRAREQQAPAHLHTSESQSHPLPQPNPSVVGSLSPSKLPESRLPMTPHQTTSRLNNQNATELRVCSASLLTPVCDVKPQLIPENRLSAVNSILPPSLLLRVSGGLALLQLAPFAWSQTLIILPKLPWMPSVGRLSRGAGLCPSPAVPSFGEGLWAPSLGFLLYFERLGP